MTQSPPDSRDTLPLFLYGTLRHGGERHDLVAPYLVATAAARVWGRLYQVDGEDYPALEAPDTLVLATGTAIPHADTTTAHEYPVSECTTVSGDWDWVSGDLVTLKNPAFCLPLLDDYEEFRPGGNSLYQRVLMAVQFQDGVAAAWTYTKVPEPGDRRIVQGCWRTGQGRGFPKSTASSA